MKHKDAQSIGRRPALAFIQSRWLNCQTCTQQKLSVEGQSAIEKVLRVSWCLMAYRIPCLDKDCAWSGELAYQALPRREA